MNPEQIYLIELKIKAIEHLDYISFVSFLGVTPDSKRIDTYNYIKKYLSAEAEQYWDNHKREIGYGIIHCGKLENYFRIFSKYILPLMHNHDTICKFLNQDSLSAQKEYYSKVINNTRWQRLFKLFFSKFIMSRLGRNKSFFNHVENNHIASTLYRRTESGLTNIPTIDNYFLEYILTHNYRSLKRCHPYLQEKNFEKIKNNINRIELIIDTLDNTLDSVDINSIHKFNLSDIFEYMNNSQKERTIKRIVKVSTPGALMAFWTLFTKQEIPFQFKDVIVNNSNGWHNQNLSKTFFYRNFCIWKLKDGD